MMNETDYVEISIWSNWLTWLVVGQLTVLSITTLFYFGVL